MSLTAQIKELEETLLHSDHRQKPDLADSLLAPDFQEIGVDGRVTGREGVLAWLKNKPSDQRWRFRDFRIKAVSDNVVLALYRAQRLTEDGTLSRGALHSSLWIRQEDGSGWCLFFHQTTRLP